MKSLKLTMAVISIAAIAPTAFAQDDGIYPTSSIESASEYVFRGVSLGASSIQPRTEISTSSGITVGAWYSAGLGPDSSVQRDEIDLYASYAVPLEGPVSVDVGGTYYFYPQTAGTIFDTDGGVAGSYEVYGAVGLDDVFLSPKGTVYYDFTLENLTLEGEIEHTVDLPRDGWSAGLGLTGGHVDSDEGLDYQWGTATVAVKKDVTENINFFVSGNFTLNSEDNTLGFDSAIDPDTGIAFSTLDSDTQFWFGTGLSVSY